MTDTIIGTLIGVGGTIIGAAIAGTISYYVAANITRKQELYREYTKFKESFSNELAFLSSDIEPDSSIHGTTYDILTKALNNHRHAVN